MIASKVRRRRWDEIEVLPLLIFHCEIQQRQKSRQRRLQSLIQCQELAGDFLAHIALSVAVVNFEICFEQVNHR